MDQLLPGVDPLDVSEPTNADRSAHDTSDRPPADRPGGDERAPGLREQIAAVRAALQRIVAAHVELARAEFSEILDEVKRVAALGGIAVAALILAGLLAAIGFFLFLGEWLFGSIGWAVLQGPLLLAGIATAAVLVALGYGGGRVVRHLVVAAIIGIVVAVILGLNLTNRFWAAVGDVLPSTVSPGPEVRPLFVAVVALAVIFGVLGLIAGARGGGGKWAIRGLVGGAILGAILGAITATALGPRIGAAIGVVVALVAWIGLMAAGVQREGIDVEALKARFFPNETIATTKETIEWVRERTPLGPTS